MGKSKNKKHKKVSNRPTGLPSVRECESEIAEEQELQNNKGDSFTGSISGIIEKLQSPSPDERQCGCTTVAVIVSQKGAIDLLMKDHVVKILGPLMLDPSLFVQQASVGALRNLSAEGGHRVCDKMVQEDIMTPLVAFLKQFVLEWKPEKDFTSKVLNPKNDSFLQAVHLLLNVCESNETAVRIANREELVCVLIPCLNVDLYGLTLSIAVSQCLLVLSENNPEASRVIKADAEGMILKIICDESEDLLMELVLLKAYAAGILYNVTDGRITEVNGTLLSVIIRLLATIFEIDTNQILNRVADKINVIKTENGELNIPDIPDHIPDITDKEADQGIITLNNILAAQLVALEVAANLCSSADDDEDEDQWEDFDDVSVEEVVDFDMENVDGVTNTSLNALCVPSEILSLLTSNNILDHVLRLCCKRDPMVMMSLVSYPPGRKLHKKLNECQCHALLCLNNMVSIEAGGDSHRLYPIWIDLTKLATTDALENLELMEATTSAMRAVIEVLGKIDSKEFHNVTEDDLVFLYDMGLQCPHAQVRVNTLRIASAIGCILAKEHNPHHLLKAIGNFLLEIVSKDNELWVVAEALDALFDVFAEDHTDSVAKEVNLVPRLKQAVPILKSKASGQKKKLGEHLAIINTTRTNLIRFIKYKNG